MTNQRIGISGIAIRLRLVLLTVVLLILAVPILVYFSTGQIISRQNEASDDLIRTENRQTFLTNQINQIANAGRRLPLSETPEDVRDAAQSIFIDIGDLHSGLSMSGTHGLSAEQTGSFNDLLAQYQSVVERVAEANATQLETETALAEQILGARGTVIDMLALLGSEIATQNINLNRDISSLEFGENQASVPAVRQSYGNLIALNSISEAVDAQGFFLSSFDSEVSAEQAITLRNRSRLRGQNLAIQIAKLPPNDLRTELARRAIEVSATMTGEGGIFDQIETLRMTRTVGEENLGEQQILTERLLDLSQTLVDDTQADLILAGQQSQTIMERTRLLTLLFTLLAGALVIGAILIVVERQFNRRISWLTDRVLSLASGKPDPGSVVERNDELSAMDDALEVFKRNAANLRDANLKLADQNGEIQRLGTQLQTVLDTTSSGIAAFGEDGKVVMANRPARHLLGGISDEAPFDLPTGIRFLNRDNLAPLEASDDPLQRALAGQILNHEIALMECGGTEEGRYIRLSSSPVKDQASVVRTVLAIDDVSEAEQNRQQIERSARLDALGQLTGGIAHDFNNLLATIQYAVQLSASGSDPKKRTEYTKIALESIERGSRLSSRLLTFAKRQPGMAKSHRIDRVLDDFTSLVSPTIEEAIDIQFHVEEANLSVFCDSAQLENALLNLVLNARDAILRSGMGHTITVGVRGISELNVPGYAEDEDPNRYSTSNLEAEIRTQGDDKVDHTYRYIEFAVTDDGPGMTDEVKRRALDPFFTTKSTNSGTGLGLSMVYGFVQQSGGELRIYSEEGQGTTMRLLLPRGSGEDAREQPILREVPVEGRGQCIFIVEDETHLRDAMEDLVISFGYTVCSAASGRDALALISKGLEFDLLLTDIVMPGGVSGFDLAAEVRSSHPNVPILYMSGYAAYTDRDMGVVVAPLLQKPCSPHTLAEHLYDALAETVPS